jgi:hypothetical protein
VWLEKGDEMSLDEDVRPLIPDNNVWLKILDRIENSDSNEDGIDDN